MNILILFVFFSIGIIQMICANKDIYNNPVNSRGENPLFTATINGKIEVIEELTTIGVPYRPAKNK